MIKPAHRHPGHGPTPRKFEQEFGKTNRLRIEGTANLAVATGGARMISESVAFGYAPRRGLIADENQPLWEHGPKPFSRPPWRHLRAWSGSPPKTGGVTLRFGSLAGTGHQLCV